jgi:hypothetical protein
MTWWLWVIVGVLIAFVIYSAWYLSSTAGRLDRLHRRIDAARISLNSALLGRSSVVSELANTAEPDPGTAMLLADAAHDARRATDDEDIERGLVESNLTRLLAVAFEDPESAEETADVLGDDELIEDLASATRRVEMSRRFLNDAVRACRDVREQRVVRGLNLAGHTPWPEPFEMDDTPPAGFGVR